jgi:UDP-N-acetyl-D-glucosamine dehydrogenase
VFNFIVRFPFTYRCSRYRGLDNVCLPLRATVRYTHVGFKVLGFDIDLAKLEKPKAGQSYIEHNWPDKITAARHAGLEATTYFSPSYIPE